MPTPYKSKRTSESSRWTAALGKVDDAATAATTAAAQRAQKVLANRRAGSSQPKPQAAQQQADTSGEPEAEALPEQAEMAVQDNGQDAGGPPEVGSEQEVNVTRTRLNRFEDQGDEAQGEQPPAAPQPVRQVVRPQVQQSVPQQVVQTTPVAAPRLQNTAPAAATRAGRPQMGRQPFNRQQQAQQQPQPQQGQQVQQQPIRLVERRTVVHRGQNVVQSQKPTVAPRRVGFGRIFDPNRTVLNAIPWSVAGGYDVVQGAGNDNSWGYYARLLLGDAQQAWPFVQHLTGKEHYLQLGQDPQGRGEILVGHRQERPAVVKQVPYARPEWAQWIGYQMVDFAQSVWGKVWEIWRIGDNGWGLYIVGGSCPHWRARVSDYYHIETLGAEDGSRAYLIQATKDKPFDSPHRVATVIEMIKGLGEVMAKSGQAHHPPVSG